MFFLDSINFFGGVSTAIQAALLLIIGLIAAAIARFVIKKILIKVFERNEKKQLAERKDTAGDTVAEEEENVKRGIFAGLMENKTQLVSIIGNLVFAVVFLLFLPGALDKLGVDSVASPISGMARKFVEFIPRIIAAIIILVFGYFLSKLARDILKVILQKTRIDSLQKKIGVRSAKNSASFSGIISNIVFALLMIIFVIAALQALQLYAISDPASRMLETVFTYLPLLFAALIVIIIGIFIANIVGGLLENVIAGTGFDDRIGEIMPKNKAGEPAIAFSKLLGIIVKAVIIIFFVVAGLRIMNIEVLTKIGTTIIAYMPNILAAIIVFLIAWFVADKLSKLILKASPDSEGLAKGVKAVVYIIAAFMILSQLHIASNIVHILFTALVIGLAAAFAIAFGVGGRHWASRKLEVLDENIEKQKAKREATKAARAAAGESDDIFEKDDSSLSGMFGIGSSKSSAKDSDKKKKGSFFSGFGKKSDKASDTAKDAADSASGAADAAADNAGAYAKDAADSAADTAGTYAKDAAGTAGSAADTAGTYAKDAADSAADTAGAHAGYAADKAGDTVSSAADKMSDAANDVADKAGAAAKDAAEDANDSPYYYKNKKDDQ